MLKLSANKLVFFMAEGFGFSTSWHGNAIMGANPKHYLKFWSSYPHFILNNPDLIQSESCQGDELKKIIYSQISSTKTIVPDKDYISKNTQDKSFYHNQALSQICDWSKNQHSSLHLIGNLSYKNGRYGDFDNILSIIKFAKLHQCFRVYVHLILDSSQTKDLNDAAYLARDLENKLQEFGVGEIASISGRKYLYNNVLNFQMFNKALQAIVFGSGNKALSVEQAFRECDKKIASPEDFVPNFIESAGKAIGKICDFDAVVFFNHNNDDLISFLNYLIKNNSTTISKSPSFLKIATMLPTDHEGKKFAESIFTRQIPKGITSVLTENNLKQAYIYDQTRSGFIEEYFQGHAVVEKDFLDNYIIDVPLNTDQYVNQSDNIINQYLQKLRNCLQSNKYNFVMMSFPILSLLPISHSFENSVVIVKKIDKMLSDLFDLVKDNDTNLIFTSAYGGAEKLTGRSQFENLNNLTANPVPFIFYINNLEKMTLKSDLGFSGDIMKSKKRITDIAPTIIDYFDLEQPNYIKGESMIKLFKEEVDYAN